MRILSGPTERTLTLAVGQLADGSDRDVVTVTRWETRIINDDGHPQTITTPTEPQPADLYALMERGTNVQPVAAADFPGLNGYLMLKYQIWHSIAEFLAAATSKGVPQADLAVIGAQESATWQDLWAAYESWKSAAGVA